MGIANLHEYRDSSARCYLAVFERGYLLFLEQLTSHCSNGMALRRTVVVIRKFDVRANLKLDKVKVSEELSI
jgi:hypothetical protein